MAVKQQTLRPAPFNLLRAVGDDAVLVGGQAVGFWSVVYGIEIPTDTGSLTLDMDFLAKEPELVRRAAKASGGMPSFPPKHAMTVLVGQVAIPEGEDQYKNVDFISDVYQVGYENVVKDACPVAFDGIKFKVIHPLHLLKSKAENYQKLDNKRNPAGRKQLEIAILIAKAYLEMKAEEITENDDSILRNAISEFVKIAKGGAGSHARKQGIDFLSAIPIDKVKHEFFLEKQWPNIKNTIAHSSLPMIISPSP